jgi:hypothetical protein
MKRKRILEPGDWVTTPNGQAGVVLSPEDYTKVKGRLKEGRRPGYYFATGCCHHPDYVLQIPVLFEDGTYDVMRSMNIKKAGNLSQERRASLQGLLAQHTA